MNQKIKVFYSWQSDLPKTTNLNAIRQCLRIAANEIENTLDDISIELDEATRKTAGSPNIPLTIFAKISTADIFICDLTTINSTSMDSRKVPNPNVLIELGYAISELGWGRIVLLFNKAHGRFPDELPFDIDRHRSTPFEIGDKDNGLGKKQLSKVLTTAINAIIEQKPIRPHEEKIISPEQKKRNHNISNLKKCLVYIHIPTMDYFLEEIPDKIFKNIMYYQQAFKDTVDSNSFHIYDQKLDSLIRGLNEKWSISLSYGHQYSPDGLGHFYRYYIPMDEFQNQKSQDEYNFLMEVRKDLIQIFKDLLTYIRYEYLEIDLDQTSRAALENYNRDKK